MPSLSAAGHELSELSTKLVKFTTTQTADIPAALDIMKDLEASTPTAKEIKASNLGPLIGTLKKSAHGDIKELAKSIMVKWSQDINSKKSAAALSSTATNTNSSSAKSKAETKEQSDTTMSSTSTKSKSKKEKDSNGKVKKEKADGKKVKKESGKSGKKEKDAKESTKKKEKDKDRSSPTPTSTANVAGTATTTSTASASSSTSTSTAAPSPSPMKPEFLVPALPTQTDETTRSPRANGTASPTGNKTPDLRRYESGIGTFELGKTGDSKRNKVQELLLQAFQPAPPPTKEMDYLSAEELVLRTEYAMFKKFRSTPEYTQKYRVLSLNLKDPKNPELRLSIYDGRIPPELLVEMDEKDLASGELKQQREADRKYARDATRSDWNKNNRQTDMFKCGKCKERRCTYYQLQTRSADEPMTTFVTCLNCGNRFRC
jgi:transcription elongation factor S-II